MEFKRLSDVEVVAEPTETANVLIEENGVIKKAPKTAVGGGDEWDMIIDLGTEIVADNDVTLELGSYNDIKVKLDSNIFPNVLCKAELEYGDIFYHKAKAFEVTYANSGAILVKILISEYTDNIPTLVVVKLTTSEAFIWNTRELL